jgi:predicted RNase H-like HicB family nuclease
MRYIALIDGEAGGYGVVFPDLPGCTAMGDTMAEAMEAGGEALRDWVLAVEAGGEAVPAPRTLDELVADPDVQEALALGSLLSAVVLVREVGRPVKANLSIDAGVLAEIDAAARRLKITRSAMVEMMARQALPALS